VTYPNEHSYVTVIGDAYGGTERWQFGFRLQPESVGSQAAADAISVHVRNWWEAISPYSTGVDKFHSLTTHRLLEVKVASIQPDGHYPPNEPSASHFFSPGVAGGSAPPAGTIPQATMAVTLTTALPRGLASKGRIFVPPSATMLPETADGKVSSARATEMAASVKRLINAINADPLVGNVAIFSRGRGVPSYNAVKHRVEYTYPNEGAVQLVTGVRVGRVIDTQRRRRRQLTELPVATTLV
jgi:hypothetical protein